MRMEFYRLKCLTNLHMGSGSTNYSVIDLEVERDPVLREATMNASGVKGALRDACEERVFSLDTEEEKNKSLKTIEKMFGSKENGDIPGSCKFFSGDLLARPVRVSKGKGSYALATSPQQLKFVVSKLNAFGIGNLQADEIPVIDKEEFVFTGQSYEEIEGIRAEKKESKLIETLLGTKNWVLMPDEYLRFIKLPVLAHNVLKDGKSDNLWYEEVVPHQSIFGLLIGYPDHSDMSLQTLLGKDPVVQFGAGASTGCGFIKMQKEEFKNE